MILAKYIKSNTTFGEEDGLEKDHIYTVKKIDKESFRVYLEGFTKSYCVKCFDFYEAKPLKSSQITKIRSKTPKTKTEQTGKCVEATVLAHCQGMGYYFSVGQNVMEDYEPLSKVKLIIIKDNES